MSAPKPGEVAPLRGVFGGTAWRVGRVAGIDIGIDHSWLLIFGLVTYSLASRLGAEHPGVSTFALWSTAVITSLAFFASIVLHELGHSLVALRTGLEVRSITLFLFGGVAQLAREPYRPRDEVLIALAGPAVSLALGAGFLFLAGLGGSDPGTPLRGAAAWLGSINVALAVFNLVPGFPLDGGRVLRGIVWGATGSFERATRVAAASGSVVAMSLMLLGGMLALATGQLLGGLWLVLIGWFLLQAARGPVGAMHVERVLQQVRIADVMESVERARVDPGTSVASALHDVVLLHGLRTLYVVGPDETLLGLVALRELASVPAEQRATRTLGEVMTPVEALRVVSSRDSGWHALEEMASRRLNQLPVVDAGKLRGCVSREGLVNVLQAALALRRGDEVGGAHALSKSA